MLVLLVDCYGPTSDVGPRCVEALKAQIVASLSAAAISISSTVSASKRKVHVEVRRADALGDLVCDWDAGMIVSDGTRQNAVRFDKYGAVFVVGAAGEQATYTPWDVAFYPLTRLVHMCYCVRKPLCGIGLGALVGVFTACTDAAKLCVVNPPFGGDRGTLSSVPPPRGAVDAHDSFGEFQRVWLDGATGDLYRWCDDGWWLPLCNCGLWLERPGAAPQPPPILATTVTATTKTTPSSPRAAIPVVQGSPRRALTRVVNGHTSPRRDTAGVHPTPSRVRAEHRQHWAVRASRFATCYFTPLRQWRVAGAAAGPKGPLVTVVDGPVGPIALSTTPTTASPTSASPTFPKKHAVVLLLAVDFDRDRAADPVRDLLGFFAAEVRRRDVEVLAALPAAQLAAEHTMVGYLFGAQGGRGKGDNWRGWRGVGLGERKWAPPVCTEAVRGASATVGAMAAPRTTQAATSATSATFTDPGPPVLATPDPFVPVNDEHLATSRLPSSTVGKALPQKTSDPLSQASRDRRLRDLLGRAGMEPAAAVTAPVLVAKVAADMTWASDPDADVDLTADFGVVFRLGETDDEAWARTVGSSNQQGEEPHVAEEDAPAALGADDEVAGFLQQPQPEPEPKPQPQPQRPATVGSRPVPNRTLAHLLATPPGTSPRPSSCATFRRSGARTVAARMETSFLPRSHPKTNGAPAAGTKKADTVAVANAVAVAATESVSPRPGGQAVGPDGVVNMGLPRALRPAPEPPLPAVARNEMDRRAHMQALKEAGTGAAAAPFVSAFDGGRGATLGFDGPEKDGLVEGERSYYMKT